MENTAMRSVDRPQRFSIRNGNLQSLLPDASGNAVNSSRVAFFQLMVGRFAVYGINHDLGR